MVKLNSVDQKKRLLFKYTEINKVILKILLYNKHIQNKIFKLYLFFFLSKFSRNSSKTRIHNRCILTGRSNGVYTYFGLSRIALKLYSSLRYIPGLRKKY